MNILGIWDGHDSGAALLQEGRLVCAINEERLTRRKLEVAFPHRAIAECLRQAGLEPGAINRVACATSDPAKTLTRIWPEGKERYYRLRRRLDLPSPLDPWTRMVKYRLTELPGNPITALLSRLSLATRLRESGFAFPKILLPDHHLCHAAAGVFAAGMEQALVITLDGVGDGLSGSVSHLTPGGLRRLAAIPAQHSLGIFFEHVTHLLNMRELEDEGKVMALADYALPMAPEDNPMLALFRVDGLQVRGVLHANDLRRRLAEILWRCTPEQFAAMAQRTLESRVPELIQNALDATDTHRLILSGGLFANVRLNGLIRRLPGVEACFVFPHMGDGGLALGAAAAVANHPITKLEELRLGPEYPPARMEQALRQSGLPCRRGDPVAEGAALLVAGRIVGWFQGRMEYGPRALGGRSILALPGLPGIRERLNLRLKRRSWYQPFCPSLLDSEAARLLADHSGAPDRFMTGLHTVRPEFRGALAGVTGRDGSCRPQMVAATDDPFSRLLTAIREKTGFGVLLNTSFNPHGAPLVCSPEDALAAFVSMGLDHLILGGWIVDRPDNPA